MSLNSFIRKVFFKPAELKSQDESSPSLAPDNVEPPATKPPAFRDYSLFCARMKPLVEQYQTHFKKRLHQLPFQPLISVILPVYNPEIQWLRTAIESVRKQIYPRWELCITDDASPNSEIRLLLEEYEKLCPNIQVVYRNENGHISQASNSALKIASGEFIALLDHDDEIPPHALARVIDCLNEHPDAALIYSDEDKIDETGTRSQPHFKSDWNPDLLLGQNFISHFGVYRFSDVKKVGGFRTGYEGAQDWDLALRISSEVEPRQIIHIPEVLYHWRSIAGSTAKDIGEKSYAHNAARNAIEDHFSRKGIQATLEPVDRFYWRPRYIHANPSVAIIIPTRDRIELLKECIDSIRSKTNYQNYQIVIANNDSADESTFQYFNELRTSGIDIVDTPGEFNFSRIVNAATRSREEEIICLLNNDTTVIDDSWLDELVMHAVRDEIGPVGAKLLYPHDHVQHAGIVLGIGGIGSEAFKFIHKTDDGYIHRAFLIGNYSAVTGACMAFRRSVWESVNGFNEQDVPNAYSDVDFCLRCGEKGYRSLFTPFAQFYHAESASRGPDDSDEFENATAYMRTRWRDKIAKDPFYNPNLTIDREDFTLAPQSRDYSIE